MVSLINSLKHRKWKGKTYLRFALMNDIQKKRLCGKNMLSQVFVKIIRTFVLNVSLILKTGVIDDKLRKKLQKKEKQNRKNEQKEWKKLQKEQKKEAKKEQKIHRKKQKEWENSQNNENESESPWSDNENENNNGNGNGNGNGKHGRFKRQENAMQFGTRLPFQIAFLTDMPTNSSTVQFGFSSPFPTVVSTAMPINSSAAFPAQFDARERWPLCAAQIAIVNDQGTCGSCWAIATAKMIQDRLCIQKAEVGIPESNVPILSTDILTCSGGQDE